MNFKKVIRDYIFSKLVIRVKSIIGGSMELNLVIAITVALAGGLLFKKLKFPAGLMVGSMLAAGVLNIFTGIVSVPAYLKFFVQVIAGAYVGMAMDKEKVNQLRTIIKPAIVMVLGLLFINISLGVLVHFMTDIDLMTSLFSTVPGGMTDVSIISQDMGADTARTAVFQLARLIGVVTFFPLIIKDVNKRINKDKFEINCDEEAADLGEATADENNPRTKKNYFKVESAHILNNAGEIVITLIVAFVSGAIGKWSGVPAGAMLFPLIGVTVLKLMTNKGDIPVILKQSAQVFAGALIGGSITLQVVLGLRFVVLPIIVILILYTILCMSLGYLISKLFKIDLITALFACTPAGASDMALIASDIGATGSQVALFQVTRLISVIAFFPGTIKAITDIFG